MISIETLRLWELQRQRALEAAQARLAREQLVTLARALEVLRVT
jgi:hypothetical protein